MEEYLDDTQIPEIQRKLPSKFNIYITKILLGLTVDIHFFLFAFLDFYLITHYQNHMLQIIIINILYFIITYFEVKTYNIHDIDYSSLKYATYIVDVEKVILTKTSAKIVYKSNSHIFGKSYMLIDRSLYDQNPDNYNKKILISSFWAKNRQNKIVSVCVKDANKYSGYPNQYI
mgnify:FL=1